MHEGEKAEKAEAGRSQTQRREACLAVIIGLYFHNNPMGHSRWFMMRRFINWFPLGMTYAFLYMGRYNLNVSKNALGA
jgi:OPA family glycerol-3-phosphate transporter-like MFS transporter